MADHKYRVIREHIGDKPYAPGDERIATPGEVSHLVPTVLHDLGPARAEKSEGATQHKVEPKVANKAGGKTDNKDNA